MKPMQHKKEFLKIFNSLCTSRMAWQVWADWISSVACGMSIAADRDKDRCKKRSEEFKESMDRIGDMEAAQKMFDIMVDAFEVNPSQDFLGEIYMELGLGSHWHGQFFTPFSLCKLMASVTMNESIDKLSEERWISVNDPACGAGATLIAAADHYRQKGINYQQRVLFIGQDIDRVTAQMCYIQLTILGCPGYVIVANTLTNPAVGPVLLPQQKPDQEYWFTVMFMQNEIWQFRKMMYMTDLQIRKAKEVREKATVSPSAPEEGKMFIFTFHEKEVCDAG